MQDFVHQQYGFGDLKPCYLGTWTLWAIHLYGLNPATWRVGRLGKKVLPKTWVQRAPGLVGFIFRGLGFSVLGGSGDLVSRASADL